MHGALYVAQDNNNGSANSKYWQFVGKLHGVPRVIFSDSAMFTKQNKKKRFPSWGGGF